MAFARLVRAALTGEPFTLYGDGEQTRDFTYVADVVAAMLAAVDAPWCGVANIGGGSRTSMNRAVEIVAGLGGELDIRRAETARGDVRHTAADTTVAATHLGYRPRTPLAEGLATMVAAERARLSAVVP
jgi:nucleoside-diphosphate-sugar epimerase